MTIIIGILDWFQLFTFVVLASGMKLKLIKMMASIMHKLMGRTLHISIHEAGEAKFLFSLLF